VAGGKFRKQSLAGAGVCRNVVGAGMICRLIICCGWLNGLFLPTFCAGRNLLQPGVVELESGAYSGWGCVISTCDGSVAGMSLREFTFSEFGLFR
jgi:hypothetical protein